LFNASITGTAGAVLLRNTESSVMGKTLSIPIDRYKVLPDMPIEEELGKLRALILGDEFYHDCP
jgi:hypothetical protein